MDRNSQMYRFFAPSKSYIAILAVVFVLFIGSVAGAVIRIISRYQTPFK